MNDNGEFKHVKVLYFLTIKKSDLRLIINYIFESY